MSRLRLQCDQLVTYCALIRKTRGIGDEANVHSSELQLQVYLLVEIKDKLKSLFGFILVAFPGYHVGSIFGKPAGEGLDTY
jgi:hypothetical protein